MGRQITARELRIGLTQEIIDAREDKNASTARAELCLTLKNGTNEKIDLMLASESEEDKQTALAEALKRVAELLKEDNTKLDAEKLRLKTAYDVYYARQKVCKYQSAAVYFGKMLSCRRAQYIDLEKLVYND